MNYRKNYINKQIQMQEQKEHKEHKIGPTQDENGNVYDADYNVENNDNQ